MREHMPSAVLSPIGVTFILEQEDPSLIPKFLTAACQQGEDTPAPYHLWSFFFHERFLSRFDQVRGREYCWSRDNKNVYRHHPWHGRAGLLDGWDEAVDGFW